jgi:uncharacterized protein YneF (UPF0154 family)
MPRLAVLNMFLGFLILALAAAAGSFIATDLTEGYLQDKEILGSWMLTLMSSAHGHTNQFALIHICFGLTLSYSTLSLRIKKLQTLGLLFGTVGMGPLMIWRAYIGPSRTTDITEIAIGFCLSLALIAIAAHAYGLARKYMSHA